MPIRPDDTIRCSFCGRTQDQVRKMIAGSGNHNVFICDECIELCSEILEEELGKQEEEDVEEEAPLFNDIHLLKPKEIKAFYMKLNQDGKTVAAMDCLVPGIGEIIGGSQREDDYDLLRKRMEEVGLDEENYQFYLDLRKYGSTHHSGFGLGFERCVMYLTGISNIRDAIPFPRTVNNCEL